MTETQERFLRTVLTRVPLDVVVELHLFPPIRRGTMETGVAVIATQLPPAPLAVVPDDHEIDAASIADAPQAAEIDASRPLDVPTGEVIDAVFPVDVPATGVIDAAPGTDAAQDDARVEDDSPYAVEPVASEVVVDTAEPDAPSEVADITADEVDVDDAPAIVIAAVPSPRMRILTAAYRHTIKGIDRGKWVVDVQEEADAPLEAVEAVLRGVRHRSTEPADPELVSLDALAALIAPARVAPAA